MIEIISDDAGEDLLWSIFGDDPHIDYQEIMSVTNRIMDFFHDKPFDDVAAFLGSFFRRLDALNGTRTAFEKFGFFCDNFDFLNLRTSVIVFGYDFYSKIIGGDYCCAGDCRSIASPLRKLFYEVVGALDVVALRNFRKSIGDFDFYSDDIFIRIFSGGYSGKGGGVTFREEGGLMTLIGSGSVLEEVVFNDLGRIRVGDFLRHVRLGIFWVYRMHGRPGGRVQIDAMFKERHASLLLVEGAGLVKRV